MSPGLPQIKSTGRNFALIALVTAIGGVFNAGMHGELHGWMAFGHVFSDGLLYGVTMACGWLFMRSPLGKYVQGLLEEKTTATVDAAGTVTMEKTTTKVDPEPPAPAK
jgi:hypothetical protein